MRTISSEQIEQAVYELAKKACLRLTPSCLRALNTAAANEEKNSAAAFAFPCACARQYAIMFGECGG